MYGLFGQTKNGLQWLCVQDTIEQCQQSINDYPSPVYEAYMVIKLDHFHMPVIPEV